ncbi:MAG: B12-binding domain-containing radical SAM protein [Oscillospiraceae bacterium]|nr:B12-binding domain-containing radical SAM protein [Oscillospiraceae bacterium]
MINVLLVNCPNRLTREPEFFPYGLGLLTSVLEQHDCYVEIYDLNLYRDQSKFFSYLKMNLRWDIIGVSGLVTTYSYQLKLSHYIKNICPNALLISGGGLASSIPELLLTYSHFDISIIGEGEKIIVEILKYLDSREFSKVNGIAWKNNDNSIILNKVAEPIKNLDLIPFPNWDKAHLPNYFQFSGFNYKGISANKFNKRADLTTTRGCPYHCTFCFNVFCRSEIRMRSVDNVIAEISELIDRYQIDSIDFLDENFCCSRKRVVELCTKIINNKFHIKWGTAARVDDVDKELLMLMKEAGCVFILYGFETGSQIMLDKMNKKISIEQSWNAFEMTESIGIDARGNLMIGHPGETKETLMQSLNFQKRRYCYLMDKYKSYPNRSEFLNDMKKRFSTVSICTPYPGTQIYYENKEKIGDICEFLINISLSDAKKFVVNLSEISTEELLAYQKYLSSPDLWFD